MTAEIYEKDVVALGGTRHHFKILVLTLPDDKVRYTMTMDGVHVRDEPIHMTRKRFMSKVDRENWKPRQEATS